jgi:hypothetical protein
LEQNEENKLDQKDERQKSDIVLNIAEEHALGEKG